MASGIYQLVNLDNQKRYIGSAKDIVKRKRDHLYKLRNGAHDNGYLQATWDMYGEDKFSFQVLKECDPEDLLLWEQIYVDCYTSDQLYNINLEVDRSPSVTLETREKMSQSQRGKVLTENHKNKISQGLQGNTNTLGLIHSEETRKKMSVSAKGKQKSEQHRQNIANAKRGKPSPIKGRKLSDSHRENLSKSLTGRNFTDEHRQNISKAKKGVSKNDQSGR